VAESDDTKDTGGKPESGADEGQAAKATDAAVAQPENRRARRAAASNKRRPGIAPRPGSPDALGTGEKVDDAFSRAMDRLGRWASDNFNIFQYLILACIAGWIGWQIYSWRSDKTAVKTGDALAAAVENELGRIGADEPGRKDARGNLDTRKAFATEEARLAAAKDGYQTVIDASGQKPVAFIGKLGLAGVLYDQSKYDDAKKLYEEVYGSELAKKDPEAKGRSLEGIGLTLEGKGDKDGALKRYQELENAEIPGFKELALYHQARLLHAKGDTPGAVERLKKIIEKLGKEKSGTEEPPYLLATARSLLQQIDPKSVPPPSPDEALQKALESFQKKLPPGVSRLPSMPAPASP
jgi:tetratricopeptide (TPR) repeat protein